MSFPLSHNHSTFFCIRIVCVAYRTGFLLLSVGFAGHLCGTHAFHPCSVAALSFQLSKAKANTAGKESAH